MSEQRRYEFRTVADFLQLTDEQLGDALEDFRTWATIQRQLADLIDTADLGPVAVHAKTDVFAWIDDGKHDMNLNIRFSHEASTGEPESR